MVYFRSTLFNLTEESDMVMVFRDLPQDVVRYRLPKPPPLGITTTGFCACPASLAQGLTPGEMHARMAIYQLAYQQAQIESTPSLLERDLLGVWN
jgi:hypothetical protein